MTEPTNLSGFSQLLAEMRRRHVVRFAFGYAAAAFVVLQLAEIVFPAFGLGEGGLRLLVVVVGLGFPPALVLAWMYDLTREGIKRTGGSGPHGPLLSRLALSALLVVTLGAAGAVGLYLDRQGVFENVAEDGARSIPVQLATYDPAAPIRSIAVLPLADNSPSGDQAYFAAGMHEELIAKLSSLEQIRVVSRTSVTRYAATTLSMPEIGRELDADVVVEGSVTRTPTRTRVTLQLIHAPSDSHIETLQWDRERIDDILSFQTEVAQEVVRTIAAQAEPVVVQTVARTLPGAQDAYLRGRYEYARGTTDGYRMAMQYFEQALEEDSSFAPALAGLAGSRFLLGLDDPDPSIEDITLAQAEARTALALDSTSVEAMDVLSLIERSMPRLFESEPIIPAPSTAPRSIQVMAMPGQTDSMVIDMTAFDTAWVAAASAFGERIEARVREWGRDAPGDDSRRALVDGGQLVMSGRFADATTVLERAVEENPGLGSAWDMLARAQISSGDAVGVVQTIDAWHESDAANAPNATQVQAVRDSVSSSGVRGYWQWYLTFLEDRKAQGRPVPEMEIAAAHAALGHGEQAFEHLFAALEAGEPGVLTLRSDPVWDDFRSDPRLRQIARQAQQMRFSPTRRRPPRGGQGR